MKDWSKGEMKLIRRSKKVHRGKKGSSAPLQISGAVDGGASSNSRRVAPDDVLQVGTATTGYGNVKCFFSGPFVSFYKSVGLDHGASPFVVCEKMVESVARVLSCKSCLSFFEKVCFFGKGRCILIIYWLLVIRYVVITEFLDKI
jgi:hypothetical protein